MTPALQAGAHQRGRSRAAGWPGKMHIAVTLEAPRATMGGLTIDKLSGRATLGADSLVVDPVSFGLFGGRYEGTLSANLSGKTPAFRWNAALSSIDVAAATAFAGTQGVVTGRYQGRSISVAAALTREQKSDQNRSGHGADRRRRRHRQEAGPGQERRDRDVGARGGDNVWRFDRRAVHAPRRHAQDCEWASLDR